MEKKIKVGVASDHAGYNMKELVVGYLDAMGYDVYDFGCDSEESCDYADYAHPLAEAVEKGNVKLGFAFCGSGNGISMTLNKHQGIRAALCWDTELAELARKHNNANVCSMPARFIDNVKATSIVDAFLKTEFEGGRHQRRIEKIPVKNC